MELFCYNENMHIEWNRVTWYSKLVAVIVFLATAALFFWFGSIYGRTMAWKSDLSNVAPLSIPGGPSANISISETSALSDVQNLPDVKRWLALFTGTGGTNPKTGGTPVIALDSQTTSTYVIHVFENMSDHIATFNWYDVDKQTGAITPEF